MSLSDKPELRKLSFCLSVSLSAGLTEVEGDNHWGHMSQKVHGAPESQEGPEKGSLVGLDRELRHY